jgi:hypothetical protein
MLESLQTGVSSNGYNLGSTVKFDRVIDHFLNYYLDALLDEDKDAPDLRVTRRCLLARG